MNEITLSNKEIEKIGEKILKIHVDIVGEIDDAILDYVDDDWKEDGEYENEYDWYCDFGRNEAEDDIINGIVYKYEKNNEVRFEIDTFIAIGKYIAKEVSINY